MSGMTQAVNGFEVTPNLSGPTLMLQWLMYLLRNAQFKVSLLNNGSKLSLIVLYQARLIPRKKFDQLR